AREVVAFKQRIENRFGDEMLGEHRNSILASDALVEVCSQGGSECLECCLNFSGRLLRHKGTNAVGVARGHICNSLGPVFPVLTIADFLNDLGIDRISPLFNTVEIEVEGLLLSCGDLCTVVIVAAGPYADDLKLVIAALVQINLVDHGLETIIMGA